MADNLKELVETVVERLIAEPIGRGARKLHNRNCIAHLFYGVEYDHHRQEDPENMQELCPVCFEHNEVMGQ